MAKYDAWTEEYEERCFQVWYLNGRPQFAKRLIELLPEDDRGRKPSPNQIYKWKQGGIWDMRADELDAKAVQITEQSLISQKAEILKRHQAQAVQLQAKALNFLLTEGFDSAASAVAAYKLGVEEERKTQGFSDLLEKLENMSNRQVEQEIIALINRATDNNQIIDGDTTDIAGTLDTVSDEE